MPKIRICLLVIILLLMVDYFLRDRAKVGKMPEVKKEEIAVRIGEKIIYDVKLGSMRLGKARFNHLKNVELNGSVTHLMTFQTELVYFNDLEKIYSDPETFLPLKVERGINVWSKKETIVEDYNQNDFTLTITKFKGKEKEEQVIKKDGPIHNAILLPYYVRRIVKLDVGWTFLAKLPTQEFEIRLVSIEDVKVPAGIFKAYRFESTPKRFEIWISADERRIPLKIRGSSSLGYTLLMREYNS